MDLISVIMPFYKKKLYFEDSLLSVLDQTYKNLEIIIIYDDVSHDDLFFIKNIIKRDNRIKLIDNKNNYGVAKARNIGLSKSSGKYIAFLDCDDVWFKDKISEQYQLMKMKNLQFSHTSPLPLHGLSITFKQFSDFATILAIVVFPTPLMPVNK